jgi:hypothetical protein
MIGSHDAKTHASKVMQRRALTNPFGYYRFDGVEVGATYILTVEAKQHQFENPTRAVSVIDELTDVDFVALPNGFSEK